MPETSGNTIILRVKPWAIRGENMPRLALHVHGDEAAFAVTDATYDSVETHRKNIEQLIQRIDSTQNVKEATDLNNRLVSENAMLQISVARLAAVQNNLNASAANDRVQAQATNAEMLRYDANYQYRTRQP